MLALGIRTRYDRDIPLDSILKRPRMKLHSAHLIRRLFPILCLALLASLGCEQRVVGVQNGWVDSSLTRIPDRPLPQQKQAKSEKGFFDNVGEALFGWTRHLGADDSSSKTSKPANANTFFGAQPQESSGVVGQ